VIVQKKDSWDFTRDEIEKILIECIDELFLRDSPLLQNDVAERAITHKLAEYLQHRITNYHVDCEYNRNFERGSYEPKEIEVLKQRTRRYRQQEINNEDEYHTVSTYPDIIVHRRLTNAHNLLIVEVKKQNSTVPKEVDHAKLKAFTENNTHNSYSYRYGVFILFETGNDNPSKPTLTWFAEGDICHPKL
jgi:hypothetical protein